jgi:bacterioferritin-associated ferredoxin
MTFDALLRLAKEYEWTLEQLMAETGCGDQCGLCRPYLEKMLETGETRFKPGVLE